MPQEKKIAITGHTSGIGKSIAELFEKKGYIVTGLSRSNGHDVTALKSETLKLISDQDIFINNAYADFDNVKLLYKIFELWQNQNKIIINIGSDSSEGNKNFPHPYAVAKAALDKAVQQLQNCPSLCRVINIRPGYVDTPRVQHVTAPKLDPRYIADLVLWTVEQPQNTYIQNLQVKAWNENL